MSCIICGRPHQFTTCREIGMDCDEKRLKRVEDARKNHNSTRSIDAAKTFSDRLRDAEIMNHLTEQN